MMRKENRRQKRAGEQRLERGELQGRGRQTQGNYDFIVDGQVQGADVRARTTQR